MWRLQNQRRVTDILQCRLTEKYTKTLLKEKNSNFMFINFKETQFWCIRLISKSTIVNFFGTQPDSSPYLLSWKRWQKGLRYYLAFLRIFPKIINRNTKQISSHLQHKCFFFFYSFMFSLTLIFFFEWWNFCRFFG